MEIIETKEITADPVAADIEKNKPMAILAYLSWLVLIPLFFAKKSKFARYHTNQGLVLVIAESAYWLVTKLVVELVWSISVKMGVLVETTMGLCNLVFITLIVIGIVNAVRGKMKELPTFGKIKILDEK